MICADLSPVANTMFLVSLGRKKTLYICLMLLTASTVAIIFSPEYYSFVVLQFIIGGTCLGSWMSAFVAGKKKKINSYLEFKC